MQHRHIRGGQSQLFLCQDIAVFQTDVIFFIKEPLLLDAGHVEDVQIGQSLLHAACLDIGDVVRLEDLADDVIRHAQLLG